MVFSRSGERRFGILFVTERLSCAGIGGGKGDPPPRYRHSSFTPCPSAYFQNSLLQLLYCT